MYNTENEKHEARMRVVRAQFRAIAGLTVAADRGIIAPQAWEDCVWQTLHAVMDDERAILEGRETIVDKTDREDTEQAQADEAQAHAEAYAEVMNAQYDDDPNPYHGNYSEE